MQTFSSGDMKNIFLFLVLFVVGGCATPKVYVNPQKTSEEISEDETGCRRDADAFNDAKESLKEKEYDRCMRAKGYKAVAASKAGRVKEFKNSWVNPDVDFKGYEAIIIDPVDVSEVKVKNMNVPGTKVTEADIDRLGNQMLDRFSRMLNVLMPVVSDASEARSKKTLRIHLVLKDIAQTNIGFNAALQVVSTVSGVPILVGSKGLFSFEGVLTDFASGEKLITVSDETRSGKNSSLGGIEGFEKWHYAYNTMDYWADCLAQLIAAKTGLKYKSQLKFKLI